MMKRAGERDFSAGRAWRIALVGASVIGLLVAGAPRVHAAEEAADSSEEIPAPDAKDIVDLFAGYPDGKGSALYWVKVKSGSHLLLRVPEREVACEVSGFDNVFWTPGGTAVAEAISSMPGIPVLVKIPRLGAARPVRPYTKARFFKIDLSTGEALRLPRSQWPVTEERKGAFVTHVPDLPEVRRRGNRAILYGEMASASTKETRQFIQLTNIETGETSMVYVTSAGPPAISSPLFADDDCVMFTLDKTVWRLKLSTGEARQIYPPAEGGE